ncbi:hypothetical protein NE237_016585 [Protea cynaroides]|uniref:Uncharacterized protein n=1 Tax=Protea cynaroides TaxID=273540 RepID=A0A9Q0HGA8_9MAGN|nr:hypothetical protein NE237_016585 [Protea cynaroides]
MGKHETLKFNFRSTFRGAKTEDKGKAVATPDSSKNRKIIPYMPLNKSITVGSLARTAPASSDIDMDQSPINLFDVALTTIAGDKKDVDSAIPSSEFPIVVVDGVELETHPLVSEPSSSNNRELEHSELLKTLSMIEEKAFNNERLELFQKYESVVLDLSKEKENTIVERRKVFAEREKAIEGKEKLEKELREMKEEKLTFSTQLEELKEEKKSLETRLKDVEDNTQIKINDTVIEYRNSDELYNYICVFDQFEPLRQSIGSVSSKKALFELRNFVVGKHPKFDFFDFIVDINALTPPIPDEKDGIPAPTNDGSNTEVDTSDAIDRLLDAQNECNTLKEELRKLRVELDSQVETTKDLLSEHAALAIENAELQEALKARAGARSPCSKKHRQGSS